MNIEISLTVQGYDLKCEISKAFGMGTDYLKVIAGGRVVEDAPLLQEQGIGVSFENSSP